MDLRICGINLIHFFPVKSPPLYHRRRLHPLSPTLGRSLFVSANLTRTAESLQQESLKTLEWDAVCKQLSSFTSTSMGRLAAVNGEVVIGRSLEESRMLLEQTNTATRLVRVGKELDFDGVEDVSGIVRRAVDGKVLNIGELCTLGKTLRSAKGLVEQIEDVAASSNGSSLQW